MVLQLVKAAGERAEKSSATSAMMRLAALAAHLALASAGGCEVSEIKGCYEDSNAKGAQRLLPFVASGSITSPDKAGTQEHCAEWCCHQNHNGAAGVEYGGQCFCADSFSPPAGTLRAPNECAATQCTDNKTQSCGGANRILVFTATCKKPCAGPPPPPPPGPKPSPPPSPWGAQTWGKGTPNWMPCAVEPAKSMPFCDHTKPTADRVKNLLSQMTQEELCGQTYDLMHPIAKVPSWVGYNWNTECLHGLGAQCITKDNVTRCPSVFPAPPGMGATFNLSIAHELGRVISDEIRAYGNANGHRGYQNRPVGVSAWGPNLNSAQHTCRWVLFSELFCLTDRCGSQCTATLAGAATSKCPQKIPSTRGSTA